MGLVNFILAVNSQQQAAPPSQVPFIVSLEDIDPLSVPFDTAFGDLSLVTETTANLSDNTSRVVELVWLAGSYDETVIDTYTLFADVVPQADMIVGSIQATCEVTVYSVAKSVALAQSSLDYVDVGTTADAQFAHNVAISFSFWFKALDNNPSGTQYLFSNLNGSGRGVIIDLTSAGLIRFQRVNTTVGNVFRINTVSDYCDGNWHHVSIFSPSTVANTKIYVDNVEDNSISVNNLSATTASTSVWLFGKNNNNTTQNFDGLIKDFAMWASDQTANRSAIYNNATLHDYALLASPPLHYWKFDNESLLDTGTSSNKLNGTFQSAAAFSDDLPTGVFEAFEYRIEEGDKDNINEESGYFVWGANVIEHEGTYYCIGNKWIDTDGFNGWVHYNRIYVGSSANKLGPFSLVTELSELRGQAWAADMVTNPNIIKIASTYYLYYVGTNYSAVTYPVVSSEARNNQCIGVASASHPAGPWTPSTNNPILEPSVSDWDQNIVNNPSVYVDGDGDINMVYKSDLNGTPNDLRLGKVKLTTWEGPVTDRSTASPNFGLAVAAEDPTIWFEDGLYWAIFKAMDNDVVPVGHGILAVSDDDGATFRLAVGEQAYDLTIHWNDATSNNYSKIERAFVLVEAGAATALFTAVLRTNNTSFNVGIDLSAKL